MLKKLILRDMIPVVRQHHCKSCTVKWHTFHSEEIEKSRRLDLLINLQTFKGTMESCVDHVSSICEFIYNDEFVLFQVCNSLHHNEKKEKRRHYMFYSFYLFERTICSNLSGP